MRPLAVSRGVKLAGVTVDLSRGAGEFRAWAVGAGYRAEARAECLNGVGHRVPHLSCTCGFYAARTVPTLLDLLQPTAASLAGAALLDVELGGLELVGPMGVRAEQQRVLGAHLLRWCARCDSDYAVPDGPPRLYGLAAPGIGGQLAVTPLCDAHAVDGSPRLSLADVAGLVRTEVSWASDAVTDGFFDHRAHVFAVGQVRGPRSAGRRIRQLRMGQVGFVAPAAVAVGPGGVLVDSSAVAPQRPDTVSKVAVQRRIDLGLELVVTRGNARAMEAVLGETSTAPGASWLPVKVRGLRHSRRLAAAVEPGRVGGVR